MSTPLLVALIAHRTERNQCKLLIGLIAIGRNEKGGHEGRP
ncbi:hypothetical protein BIWAKO_03808 [Bosea sp. BIWAKO-01]|nr:hypothetical protein BIWAKO_03808 [Bosea sp. BIWAKO-01]